MRINRSLIVIKYDNIIFLIRNCSYSNGCRIRSNINGIIKYVWVKFRIWLLHKIVKICGQTFKSCSTKRARSAFNSQLIRSCLLFRTNTAFSNYLYKLFGVVAFKEGYRKCDFCLCAAYNIYFSAIACLYGQYIWRLFSSYSQDNRIITIINCSFIWSWILIEIFV